MTLRIYILMELIEGIHYFVDGIVDDAQVILGDKIYNSPDVDFATSVTVWISITDTDNYTLKRVLNSKP